MKFLELHFFSDGRKVFINPDFIRAITRSDCQQYTEVYFTNNYDARPLKFRETTEEILKKIND